MDRGIDIHDWFNMTRREDGALKLSSRRLINKVRRLPEESEFKTELRDGDWTFEQYLQAAFVNEQRLARADFASINGHKMVPVLFKSPRQEKAYQAKLAEHERIRKHISEQLNRGSGG